LLLDLFFIPNVFFEYYGWVAVIASGIFILVQLLWLVDFAHDFSAGLVSKWEETESKWYYVALLGCTTILYIAAISATIAMYVLFCKDPSRCALNVIIITLNLVFGLLVSLISIHPKIQEANPSSGILQASLVSAYCSYLIWSAIMSEPASEGCNPFKSDNVTTGGASLLIGVVFTIVAVCYSTFRTASKAGELEPLTLNTEEEGDEEDGKKEKEKEGGPVPYNFSIFHLIFAMGAMYIAMLMTDWHTIDQQEKGSLSVDTGYVSVWVKIVSSWCAMALYLWTLLAPVCFPNRDFGYKKDTTF